MGNDFLKFINAMAGKPEKILVDALMSIAAHHQIELLNEFERRPIEIARKALTEYFKKESLDQNLTTNEACPVGSVFWYLGPDLPAGWLWCDGSRVPDSFPKLREIIEWTPDLRESPTFRPHHIIRAE